MLKSEVWCPRGRLPAMAHINDVPDGVTQAGLDFDYTDPPSFIEVVLVNVPIDPDHLNVVRTAAAMDTFIAAQIAATPDPTDPGGAAWTMTLNLQDPSRDLQVEVAYQDALLYYNYGRLTIGTRNWYVFYSPEALNKNITKFMADIDEWLSYEWTLGYSMIERGHIAVAAAASAPSLAQAWAYCLEPESFSPADLIAYNSFETNPLGDAAVLVVSAVDLRANPFVAVDADVVDTMQDIITNPQATGTVVAEDPAGGTASFNYVLGNAAYDDLFYYPYADSPGLSGGTMRRPFATGASPSMIDGVAAEGGAFVYGSVLAYVEHMALLAHTPWMVGGITRAVLIPGGGSGSGAGVPLTPWDSIEDTSGAVVYHATYTTASSADTTLTADFTSGLPAEFAYWLKLTTSPYLEIQIGDRVGGVENYAPQAFNNAPSLRLHTESAYYPHADVSVWLTDADGGAAQNAPLSVPVGADLPHFEVGRDAAYASGSASIAAERAQSQYDALLAEQRALIDNIFTLSSNYMATQYAIAETI